MRSECPDDVLERWRGAIAAIISHYLDHWYRDRAIQRYKDRHGAELQFVSVCSRLIAIVLAISGDSGAGPTAHAQAGPGYRHRTRAQREFVLREREGGGSGRAARRGAAVRQAVTLHEAATLVECGRGHSRDLLKVNRAPVGSARRPAHTLQQQTQPPETFWCKWPRLEDTHCMTYFRGQAVRCPAPARLFLYRVTSDFLVHA